MGCDIHLYAETFDGKKWNVCPSDDFFKWGNPIYEGNWQIYINSHDGQLTIWTEDTDWNAFAENELLHNERFEMILPQWKVGRNYDLFARLVGVRSYGDDNEISAPRGIPEDTSIEIDITSRSYGCDGHSHSHIYIDEVLEEIDEKDFPTFYALALKLKDKVEDSDDARFVFFFDN